MPTTLITCGNFFLKEFITACVEETQWMKFLMLKCTVIARLYLQFRIVIEVIRNFFVWESKKTQITCFMSDPSDNKIVNKSQIQLYFVKWNECNIQKRYCKSYVISYCYKVCSIYHFKVFNWFIFDFLVLIENFCLKKSLLMPMFDTCATSNF